MEDCVRMIRVVAESAGASELRHRGAACDPFADVERISVADAFLHMPGSTAGDDRRRGVTDRGAGWTDMESGLAVRRRLTGPISSP